MNLDPPKVNNSGLIPPFSPVFLGVVDAASGSAGMLVSAVVLTSPSAGVVFEAGVPPPVVGDVRPSPCGALRSLTEAVEAGRSYAVNNHVSAGFPFQS